MRWREMVAVGPVLLLLHCDDNEILPRMPADASTPSVAPDAGTSDAAAEGGSTAATVLAASPGKDEDPSLVRAADGTFYVAWYSDRNGGDHLYIKSSTNGRDWSPDRALTNGSEHDFYPSLIQAADGTFHLVWWRGEVGDGGKLVGSIWTMHSKDTLIWSVPARLSEETNALAWAPTIAERVPGELVVVWSTDESGQKDLRLRISKNGGVDWQAPTTLVEPAFADDLPFIVARPGGALAMVWQRFDVGVTALEAPFTHASNELVYATSSDGVTWTPPLALTNDPPAAKLPDVIASLYPSNDATGLSVAWTSVRAADDPGRVYTMGIGKAPAVTANLVNLTEQGGYSARIVAAGDDRYLMAFVGSVPAADGGKNLEIFARYFMTK